MHGKPNGFAQNFLCPVFSTECTAMCSSQSNAPNLINVSSNNQKLNYKPKPKIFFNKNDIELHSKW